MEEQDIILGDNFIIIPSNNNTDNVTSFLKNENAEFTLKLIGIYLTLYILFTIYIYI